MSFTLYHYSLNNDNNVHSLLTKWCVLVQRHTSDIRGPRDADGTLCVDCDVVCIGAASQQ